MANIIKVVVDFDDGTDATIEVGSHPAMTEADQNLKAMLDARRLLGPEASRDAILMQAMENLEHQEQSS